ncbi:metallophosphoesterase family protein [Chroococcidiopsis sp. CCMEE 29]|uniref:metallophosphoesterase family protein n=1 Tax=Chroococcidiopsis sp. CCMEE 29 TaxID=155894 RepID=UPI0020229306|nr:metallophosphoesterase family protein [Chroococcidiopsis sp. CCMEE 29]
MSEASYRRIVIGDVHGYYDGLMLLLEAIAPGSDDQVYFLGDLIDRGPQSSQVVDFVQQSSYYCLLGNHEQMLIDVLSRRVSSQVRHAWLYSGGYETLNSYKKATVPEHHLEWLLSLPTHLDLGDIWLVHAGIDPRIPLAEQTAEQFCWVREEFHSMRQPYFPNKLIVVGHTITFTLPGVRPGELAQGQGWLDIDTGAYHRKSGFLTGLDLTNRLVYQVDVFDKSIRTLPLEEVVTRVDPARVVAR